VTIGVLALQGDFSEHLVSILASMALGEFFGLPEGWPFFDQDPDDDAKTR
jgi:hypothetical protein